MNTDLFGASFSVARHQEPALAIAEALNGYARKHGKAATVIYVHPDLADRLQVEPPLMVKGLKGISANVVYAGGAA